jgi:hypothetical protein
VSFIVGSPQGQRVTRPSPSRILSATYVVGFTQLGDRRRPKAEEPPYRWWQMRRQESTRGTDPVRSTSFGSPLVSEGPSRATQLRFAYEPPRQAMRAELFEMEPNASKEIGKAE